LIWTCPKCSIEHDRDHNATINIPPGEVKILKRIAGQDLELGRLGMRWDFSGDLIKVKE